MAISNPKKEGQSPARWSARLRLPQRCRERLRQRDPYRPFNLSLRPKPIDTTKTSLEQYDVSALKLVAVIYDSQNPKAMIEDDTGLRFTIGIGTKIGNQGGVVKAIDPDRVVVEEEFVDFYGEKKKTEIILRLKAEGEKRPQTSFKTASSRCSAKRQNTSASSSATST